MKVRILKNIFQKMDQGDIKFALLRGGNDIPDNISIKNDIDLILDEQHFENAKQIFNKFDFKHYEDDKSNNIYLYHAKPHHHFMHEKLNLHFDIVFNFSCRSLNQGEWVSLHEEIQQILWKDIKKVNQLWKYQLSEEMECLHLICHLIFDKRSFLVSKHTDRIEELMPRIDKKNISSLLNLVFFKFTPYLLEMIEKKDYENIINNYIQFKEY